MEGIAILAVIIGIIVVMTIKRVVTNELMFNPKWARTCYIIERGKHFSYKAGQFFKWPWKVELSSKTVCFTATFGDGTDQHTTSINKLYGIVFGFDPHYRSARIGWRYNKFSDRIELFSYVYVNGKREHKFLCRVKRYEPVQCFVGPSFVSAMNAGGTFTNHYATLDAAIMFKLFPYFGGKKTSERDLQIFIQEDDGE
jgi:hypothetical protein